MDLDNLNSFRINICSKSQLMSLKGIGKCIAKRIIKERAKRAFTSDQDLIDRVKGIGQKSWARICNQNKACLVYGEMNRTCRGKLIMPRDPTFYRKGEWIVIDPLYQDLYPGTLWGVIESDRINQKGMLSVRTGRVQVQKINWQHCVIEPFRRKELAILRNSELYKARMGDSKGLLFITNFGLLQGICLNLIATGPWASLFMLIL